MRQLQRNTFKNIHWAIICFILLLIMCFFPSCAVKKDQNINDQTTTVQQQDQEENTITVDAGIDKQPTISTVKAIDFLRKSNSLEVFIKGNKELKYTSIKQSFPFGIAIYLPGTVLDKAIASITPEACNISNIVPSYADKDKTTAKIEILLSKDLPYYIKEEGKTLRIILANETKAVTDKGKTGVTKKVKVSKGIATLSDIEFTVSDEGESEIMLLTSHPIKYDFKKGKKGILYLNLYKTNIPRRHKRPFETKYFKSAVSQILPTQKSKKSKNSKIEITLREKVPYHVIQDNNTIVVRFEPSSIEPPKFTKADKTPTSKATADSALKPIVTTPQSNSQLAGTPPPTIATSPKDQATKPSEPIEKDINVTDAEPVTRKLISEEEIFNTGMGKKEYTGEKIKLDFYETDIKNVFRILSSISNKNFAIDKDVTGSVTLTLDRAIPWDQVLDLILEMNQLGKSESGDVIRIATQAALATEAQQKHAKFKAIQEARKAQKALQPMSTKYIPINYANATTDIMPHIKQILTPTRGKVSVDARTNTIIITDTNEVLMKAKNLIYTLDNVTPQILIKAKVVEANRDFSRSLGIGAGFGFNEDVSTHGNDAHTVSLNSPADLPVNAMSFTFNNLVAGAFGDGGTSFLTTTLSASETKGDISIVSSPKILTLDNATATIKQGLQIPYTIYQDGEKVSSYKNVDLLLEVTPHVTPDKRISMKIFVTKNELSAADYDGQPGIATNEARTTLLVNDNDTIVIGGVFKSIKTESESGFPLLMSIPLLGRLFRTDTDVDNKQELLIFITPTIVQLKQKRIE